MTKLCVQDIAVLNEFIKENYGLSYDNWKEADNCCIGLDSDDAETLVVLARLAEQARWEKEIELLKAELQLWKPKPTTMEERDSLAYKIAKAGIKEALKRVGGKEECRQ